MEYITNVFGATIDIANARTTFSDEDTWVGGLIWGHPEESLFIGTGIIDGPVSMETYVLDAAPDRVDAGWEDVSEVSFWSAGIEPVIVAGTEDFIAGTSPAFMARIDEAGEGWYRIRVHALGRDVLAGEWTEAVVEHYLVLVWKAPEAAPLVYRVGSNLAREAIEAHGLGGLRGR